MFLTDSDSTSAKATIIAYNVLPLLFAFLVFTLKTRLHTASIKARIGELYAGLTTESAIDSWSHYYAAVFMLRRSLFVVLAFKLLEYPSL